MSEKTKRKGTPIHPYMRLFAAFLPCIGIGILEVVFFLSTGYSTRATITSVLRGMSALITVICCWR